MQEYVICSCTPMYRIISLRNADGSTSKFTSSLLVESQIPIVSKGYVLPVLDAAPKAANHSQESLLYYCKNFNTQAALKPYLVFLSTNHSARILLQIQ